MVVASLSAADSKAFVSSSAVPTVPVLSRVVSVLCSSTGVAEVKGTIGVASGASLVSVVVVSVAGVSVLASTLVLFSTLAGSFASAVTGAAVIAIATAKDKEIIFPVCFFIFILLQNVNFFPYHTFSYQIVWLEKYIILRLHYTLTVK